MRRILINTAMVFVPPPFCADAILEAADAGVELIVAITEGIPVRDMMTVKTALAGASSHNRAPASRSPWANTSVRRA